MPELVVAVAAAAASAGTIAALSGPLIAAGFVTGAGALSFGGALIAGIAGAVVAAGVGYGLSSVFGLNRVKGGSARAQDRKQTIRSSIAPRQVVYGTARVSGPIVYASSSGDAKQFLHLIVPLAGHRVNGPLALWINDDRIPFADINPADSLVTTGKYANRVRFQFFAGDQTTACSAKDETTDGWSADHILRETAYMYLRLEYDRDVFANGPGALSVEMQGHRQILDPRTNVTGFSNNPALCILHYLTGADGLACSADEIDTASFITAANVCDELVTISAGGTTQRRYTLDGAFTLDATPLDIIDDMLTSCAGTLVYVQGRYRLYAGAYDAPTDTLTASDLAGEIELVTKPPRRELFNTVRGTFINPGRNWQASEFPAYSETAIVTADGETITRDVEWPFTTDEIRAQRLAKLTLRRAREALTVRVPVKYAGLRYCVWQTLNVTLADFGWTNKPFRIVSWSFDAASGIINLTLREESANSYAWQFGDAQPLPLAPDTDLVDPLAIPAPTGVTVTASTVLQADGSVAPALLVTWTASAFAFLIAHEVQWRAVGATDWNSGEVPVGTNRFVIAPAIIGTAYQVRVRGVTGIARGAWSATVTGTGAADSTAPDAPTGLSATGITRGISVAWALPTASDLAAVEVWENTSSSTAGLYFVGETRGTGFVRTGLNPNVTRHYWVRSRDLSGNLSAYVGPVSATTSLLVADDIQNGILSTAKFAAGITPVEIVSSLPTTGNFEGRMVFLTTDDKLYRWTGTAWTAAVPAADVTGALAAANFPSDLRPVEIVTALPTTGNFAGRTVFLTTDSKIYRWTGSAWTAAVAATDINGTLADAQIAALAASKITGQLTSAQIAALEAAKLTGQITTTQISDNAISTPKIAAGAVTTNALAANAVTANTIAANAITSGKIAAGAVETAALAAGSVVADKLAAASVTAGKIAANAVEASTIAANAITSDKIQAGAVSAAAIAANAISADKIIASAVTAEKIATNAITSDKIVANAITAGKIAAAAIGTTELAAGAVRATNLASETLITQTAQIGVATIDTLRVQGDAVTTFASNFSAGPVSGNNAYQTIVGLSFTLPEARSGLLVISFQHGYGSGNRLTGYKVRLGSTTIFEREFGVIVDNVVLVLPRSFSSGFNEFFIDWLGADSTVSGSAYNIAVFSRIR